MSSEQTFSANDLRSAAQDSKRDAARKAKWAMGAIERVGQGQGHPRPIRPSDTNSTAARRADKGVSSLQHIAKVTKAREVAEGTSAVVTDESSGYDSDDAVSQPANTGVMYSFDASRSPTQGSQILNAALAQAVEKFEERETVNLIKTEYDVLDAEGQTLVPTPIKKEKSKAKKVSANMAARVPDADEDYEFL